MNNRAFIAWEGFWVGLSKNGRGHKAISVLLLAAFFLFMLAQHALVFPYHDDWGYATLTYTTDVGAGIGQQFTQHELLRFLYSEYTNWSGRFFPFYLQINLFSWGIEVVRFSQVLILTILVVSATAIARKSNPWHPVVLVPIIYILALPEFVTIGGLYWFSASIAYVWGIAFFSLATWRVARDEKLGWSATFLYALAALFHEQMAIAMPAFVLSYGVMHFLFKRDFSGIRSWGLKLLVTVSAGALVIFSPGNFVRREASYYPHEGMLETIVINLGEMSHLVLHPEGRLALLAFLATIIVYGAVVLTRMHSTKYTALGIIISVMLLGGVAWQAAALFLPFFIVLFSTILLLGVWYKCVPIVIAASFFAAIASLVLLLLAPAVAARTLLIFYCIMLVPVTHAVSVMFRGVPILTIALVLILGILAANKAWAVYLGYAQNAPIHQLNSAKLLVAGAESKMGHKIHQLVLYKLPNDRFAETMPYQRALVEQWMRRYYQVPVTIHIEWEMPEEVFK